MPEPAQMQLVHAHLSGLQVWLIHRHGDALSIAPRHLTGFLDEGTLLSDVHPSRHVRYPRSNAGGGPRDIEKHGPKATCRMHSRD